MNDNAIESEAGSTAETEKPAAKTQQTGIKRIFAKRVTSVSINDTNIKLTVFRGNELEKWVTCPLEQGVVVGGIVQDSYGLSETLKKLFKDHKVKTSDLIFDLSGLHAITRIITLPRVSPKVLREAIIYEAERELPVPIDSVYLFWQIIEGDSQEMKVFLIAYAQNTIDALMDTLRKAGIKPHLLQLAPLAIVRCVNSPTSIVFDVRPGELDIVVTIDNIPELIRSVPLPSYNIIEENLPIILPIVLDELQRTITFCKSTRSIETLPIFGFGDLGSEIFESLSTALNHPITLSYPPLDYPPEFSPDNCSVNLGLALGKMKLPGYEYSRSVNINLMPETYKGRIITQKALVATGATLASAALVTVLVLLLLAMSETDSIRSDLDDAKVYQTELLGQKNVLQGQVNNLNARKAAAISEGDLLSSSQLVLEDNQTSINNDLKELEEVLMFKKLPSGVDATIKNLSSSIGNTRLELKGKAATEKLALDYIEYLEKTKLFSSIICSINSEGTYTLSLQKGD